MISVRSYSPLTMVSWQSGGAPPGPRRLGWGPRGPPARPGGPTPAPPGAGQGSRAPTLGPAPGGRADGLEPQGEQSSGSRSGLGQEGGARARSEVHGIGQPPPATGERPLPAVGVAEDDPDDLPVGVALGEGPGVSGRRVADA